MEKKNKSFSSEKTCIHPSLCLKQSSQLFEKGRVSWVFFSSYNLWIKAIPESGREKG